MPQVRRLTAILAADVAGYSRLMGADEEGTHERLKTHLGELVNPKIGEHRGRIVKNTGDGFLAMFDSASRAVRCGLKITQAAHRIGLGIRVGCHTGEIALVAGSARGVAVHTAARVMATAEAGNVFVSKTTRDLLAAADFGVELRDLVLPLLELIFVEPSSSKRLGPVGSDLGLPNVDLL